MYSTVTTDTSIQTRVLFTSNHQISRAVESSLLLTTRIIYNSSYNCFINSDSITTELNTKKKKGTLTFTHSGQFFFIYFWLSVPGMPLFLIMKNCFGLFIF